MDADQLRAEMVRQLRATNWLVREDIEQAFLTVPREAFLPEFDLETVYTDRALVIKRDSEGMPISSSSQPAIMTKMLEQLDLRPGHRVLEIGAGTGYNAALMAELLGEQQLVVTVDIDAEVVERATNNLAGAGYPDVHTVCVDGAFGYAPEAPYDRIIATVGVWDLAPAWLEQLAPEGILVVPIDLAGVHRSIAFVRKDDHLVSNSIVDCGFMRMRGSARGPEVMRVLDRERGLGLMVHDGRDVDAMAASLQDEPVRLDTRIGVRGWEVFGSMMLWLAGAGLRRVDLYENNDAEPSVLGETHVDFNGVRLGPGIGSVDSIAVLTRSATGRKLLVKAFGPSAAELAEDLAEQVREWDRAGRPSTNGLRVEAYPIDAQAGSRARHVVYKDHTALVLSWPDGT